MPEWKEEILRRLAPLKLTATREAEIAEEIAQHLEDRYWELLNAGKTEAEARRMALAELSEGDLLAQNLRPLERKAPRDVAAFGGGSRDLLGGLAQDIRFAFRMLRKSPGFTAVAVLTLALGIGANTAIFSMVNGILLSALPYPEAKQIYSINEIVPQFSSIAPVLPVNSGNFLLWRDRCPAFSAMAALLVYPYNMTGEGVPRHVYGAEVSPVFFSLFGAKAQIGRFFSTSASLSEDSQEIVLTQELWRNVFHSDPNTLGKAVSLNGFSYTIVGVLASDFHVPKVFGNTPQIFMPIVLRGSDLAPGIGNFNYAVIARLRDGASPRQALAQLNVVEGEIAAKGDKLRGAAAGQFNLYAKLTPLKTMIVEPIERALWMLMVAAAFVLLIVCANLANLMLVRNSGRSHDVAVRAALGASPRRLAQQFLVEALCLTAGGGALGLLVAYSGLKFLVRNAPVGIPRLDNIRMDHSVLWFTLGISAVVTALFALFPSLRFARISPVEVLRSSGPTTTKGKHSSRLYSALIVSEIALCCVLLMGALLLVQSLTNVVRANRWMAEQHVLAISLTTPLDRYKTDAQRYEFYSKVSRKVEEMPGVLSAGWVSKLPLLGTAWGDDIRLQEAATPSAKVHPMGEFRFVSPGYLRTIGIPLVRGRWFSQSDDGQNVAVISESVAKNLVQGHNPIGMHLLWEGKARRVIGVVGDVRTAADDKLVMAVYVPIWSFNESDETLVVRTSMDPRAASGAIRSAIWSVDSQIAIPKEETLKAIVQATIASRQYETFLGALFASFAMLLAVLGLYGVISYSVSQSTHEFGIRMALGAQRQDVLRLVLGRGGRLALLGVGIGIVAALVLTRLLKSLLFGVDATDPMTLTAVAVLLVLVALAACYIPARRATRVDPMVALRYE